MGRMLLIHPPVAKPCEPPAGIARLAGALQTAGVPCRLLDASLEGLLWLTERPPADTDTWTRRAAGSRERHLAALRDPRTYGSFDRYTRAVRDLNRLAAEAGREAGATAGLADFRQADLSPLRSADLLRAAESPEHNVFHPWFSMRLEELLGDGAVRTVAFSLNFLSQALCTFAMIGHVRKRYPGLTIVLGGGLVTSWLRRPGWRNPFGGLADHLVDGPGEQVLLALAGARDIANGPALPAYEGLPLASYLSPGTILPFSTAAGCWWNRCSFCPERAEGTAYRPLPVPQALAGLRTLAERHRPVLIHLLDNAVSPALLRGLVEQPPGAPWYGFARFGEELADPAFCRSLRRAGCVMLKLGLESGDQGVLDRLSKGIDLAQASRILDNLARAGIGVYLYLLFGTPAETHDAARRTLAFVARHRDAITFLNLAIFNMPAWGEEADEFGTAPFYEGDLTLYTGFRHPGGWDRKEVRNFLDREFRREPSVAAILRRDPPLFTSNHAALFTPGFRERSLPLGSCRD